MIDAPAYSTMEKINFSMSVDRRPYTVRLDEFFIKTFAVAKTSLNQIGTQRTLISEKFYSEAPARAIKIMSEIFEVHELSNFGHLNHGNHSFGDPSKLMSYSLSFVAYDDIMNGRLQDLTFYQYLAPGSILVCIQYGASGHLPPPAGLEGFARYFSSLSEVATASFLRIERKFR